MNYIQKTEENIRKGERYLVQLSINQDHSLYNLWDYVESFKTLKEAESVCGELFDNSVHKLQIVDIVTNQIVRNWT